MQAEILPLVHRAVGFLLDGAERGWRRGCSTQSISLPMAQPLLESQISLGKSCVSTLRPFPGGEGLLPVHAGASCLDLL